MPTLAAVYADTKLTSRNPKILAKRAGTTAASAKRFLANQASSQIREQYVRPNSSVYSPTGAPQDFYQGDVVYFDILRGANKGHRSMLTIMNTTTRYVYARPLRTTTAAAAAEAMRSILDSVATRGKKMVSLRVDGGVEFKGVFKALMADRKIALLTGEANTHYRLSRTDRFHGTIRGKIGNHFEINNTDNWVDALDDMIHNYNDSPHRTVSTVLGYDRSPAEITLEEEDEIREDEIERSRKVRHANNKLPIQVGSKVRLLYNSTKRGQQDRFSKTQAPIWTPEMYSVLSRAGPNSWEIDVEPGEVRIWPSYSLQFIDESKLQSQGSKDGSVSASVAPPRVNIRTARAKRMEARNLSEKENEAALAGPARPKRSTRVDYAALANKPNRFPKIDKN